MKTFVKKILAPNQFFHHSFDMKTPDQVDLETEIDQFMAKITQALSDSPHSLTSAIRFHIGYYNGFCAAKNWNADQDLVLKWEQNFPKFRR